MDLEKIIHFIIKCLRNNNYKETKHFREKCKERELDIENIRNILKKNKILGLEEQNKNLYKIFIYYNKTKDLIIIINTAYSKIKLLTVFIQDSLRRKRK